ncbi:MAG: hypothetical protein ACRDD7_13770 [Peptostreptococcaceae bacterium]
MMGIEKDILILISRVRCITEVQVGKIFGTRKRYGRRPFKKALRKMCNEYTLRKYPCNINYTGYRDNTYVYCLNGGKVYKGDELAKAIIGSEIAIRFNLAGYQIKRFYRNPSVGNSKYDLFIEYVNKYNEPKQIIIDIRLDEKINMLKYQGIEHKIEKSTIPFYDIPKILIVTSEDVEKLQINNINNNVEFLDLSLNKLFKYI